MSSRAPEFGVARVQRETPHPVLRPSSALQGVMDGFLIKV